MQPINLMAYNLTTCGKFTVHVSVSLFISMLYTVFLGSPILAVCGVFPKESKVWLHKYGKKLFQIKMLC